MSQNSSREAWVWIAIILGVAVWWEIHLKVIAFGETINVNPDTAGSVLLRGGILLVLLIGAFKKGFLRQTLPYLPFALLIVIMPALDYWSWNFAFKDVPMNREPAWYGVSWIQNTGAVLLGGLGLYFHLKSDDY